SAPIPTDTNLRLKQTISKIFARKLDPLVGIENLRSCSLQSSIKRLQTKTGIQGVGQLPSKHEPTEPIKNCYQIDKASCQADVGDIAAPDLVDPINAHPTQQIGITNTR